MEMNSEKDTVSGQSHVANAWVLCAASRIFAWVLKMDRLLEAVLHDMWSFILNVPAFLDSIQISAYMFGWKWPKLTHLAKNLVDQEAGRWKCHLHHLRPRASGA